MQDIIELNYSISVKKSPNSGIEILKIILTFLILVYHSLSENIDDNETLKIFIQIVPLYFSTFFLIFFYFIYNIFSSRNISKIKERFTRILIPYLYWPFLFSVLNIISTDKKIKKNHIIRDLFIQIIIGRRIYFVFWFQFNLIIISLIFTIILFSFKKFHINIFLAIFLFAYFFEYLGFSEKFFSSYNEEIKRSIGRTLKMMIFAITGFFLSSIKMLNHLKYHKIKSILLSVVSFVIIIYLKIYFSDYYFLEGIFLILGSISLLIAFALLPLSNITNMTVVFLIKQSTSYTAGVYYLHVKVLRYFEDSIDIFKDGELRGCALNYLICYSICFIGMKLFGKTKFKYLFI